MDIERNFIMENRIWKKGDIVFVKCESSYKPGVQSGVRPYIIISNDKFNIHAPVLTCVALSAKTSKKSPVHLYLSKEIGLPRNSIALCEQICTISKCDIESYICSLPESLIVKLNNLLSFQLSL